MNLPLQDPIALPRPAAEPTRPSERAAPSDPGFRGHLREAEHKEPVRHAASDERPPSEETRAEKTPPSGATPERNEAEEVANSAEPSGRSSRARKSRKDSGKDENDRVDVPLPPSRPPNEVVVRKADVDSKRLPEESKQGVVDEGDTKPQGGSKRTSPDNLARRPHAEVEEGVHNAVKQANEEGERGPSNMAKKQDQIHTYSSTNIISPQESIELKRANDQGSRDKRQSDAAQPKRATADSAAHLAGEAKESAPRVEVNANQTALPQGVDVKDHAITNDRSPEVARRSVAQKRQSVADVARNSDVSEQSTNAIGPTQQGEVLSVRGESPSAADELNTDTGSPPSTGGLGLKDVPQRSQAAPPGFVLALETAAVRRRRVADGEERMPVVDRVRFVQRVFRAFQEIGPDGGQLSIRLHPPELGSLRLDLVVRNGAVAARLEAETAVAKSLLLENIPALREKLAAQDIRLERFDVELNNRPRQEGAFTPQGNSPRDGSNGDSRPRARTKSADQNVISTMSGTAANMISSDRLNVIV